MGRIRMPSSIRSASASRPAVSSGLYGPSPASSTGRRPASSAGDYADLGFVLAKSPGAPDKGKAKPGAKKFFEDADKAAPLERALKGQVNDYVTLLTSKVPAHRGKLGHVSKGLNVVLGTLNIASSLLDTGFAVATAPLAAMLPAFPAATMLSTWHMGIPHAHSHPPSLIPPAPPIPLPSAGAVVASCAQSVLINGKPAARAGDCGIAPVCFSFAPPFEITTGSSNVFLGGGRAARQFDITIHCNPLGALGALVKVAKCLKAVAKAGKVTKALAAVAKISKIAKSADKVSKIAKVASVGGKVLAGAGLVAGGINAITSDMDADNAKKKAEKQLAKADAAAAAARESGSDDAAAAAAQASANAASAGAAAAGDALAATLAAAQLAADAAGMAMSMLQGKDPGLPPGLGMIALGTSPNVKIGGLPTPNLMDCLKGLLKAAGGAMAKKMKKGSEDGEGGDAPQKTGSTSCPQ